MNPYSRLAHCVGLFITPLLTAWLFVSCASTPKVDWNTRVGNYT